MDILFQIHYEWNKELFFLYYQTQNRKYRRILLFFCGAVIIFSFCLCNKIEREMIMTMMILFVCAVILVNNIYLRLATYIQMETVLKQYGTGKRIMTIKKDEINVLVPESGRKIIVSFIEIMEIGTIKEYCWIREMMGNYLKENNVRVKDGTDVNSIMRDMMSIILKNDLDQEMDEDLEYSKYDHRNKETDNSRNGHSKKTMHTSFGDMEIDIPRVRKGEFEPRIVKKYQNTVTQNMEEKIISKYAKGLTTNDIESHMRELYDIEISDSTISLITDKIFTIVKEWQEKAV